MNMRNTVLASRIDAALDNVIPPELISAGLRIIARTPLEALLRRRGACAAWSPRRR